MSNKKKAELQKKHLKKAPKKFVDGNGNEVPEEDAEFIITHETNFDELEKIVNDPETEMTWKTAEVMLKGHNLI